MVTGGEMGAAAMGVDAVIGDSGGWPHPVVLMGAAITRYDQQMNRSGLSPGVLKVRGLGLAIGLPLVVGVGSWGSIWALGRVWSPLGWIVALGLISTTLAWKGLGDAGRHVYRELSLGLVRARRAVGEIVGRDTHELTEAEVIRATVETLAENIVDGIVAPLFYAVLGGAPLAMAYRAVNTLDSMVGYKSSRYRHFGWASARLDDVMNFVPARLTALLLWAVMAGMALAPRRAWRTMVRQAHRHPSPNAGIPEAMMAGGLGVRLGGRNVYGGVPSLRAELGEATRPLDREDIVRAVQVVRWTGAVAAMAALLIGVLTA